MEFKSHPYYDGSDAHDWLYLRPDNWTELERGPEKRLQDLLRAHKPWLCELALDRIRAVAGADYVAERPFPEVNEFLFFPINDTGYRVYIEYFFNQWPDAISSASDYWWAVINCPYVVEPFPTGRREANVIGLGWYVA